MFFIIGVGIFANNKPVLNNTAVLADNNNQTGVIYCNSGSKVANIGQWFSPSGVEITQNSGGTFTIVRGGGIIPSFIGLQLKAGRSLSTSDEGIYTCLIPNENGVQQVLQIGLYLNGYIGEYLRMAGPKKYQRLTISYINFMNVNSHNKCMTYLQCLP